MLVRDTLYDDAPRLRRGRWHARVGAALEALHPHDVAALAYHFHQAGTVATARQAVDYDIRAADQAVSRYAHETAAALYEQALTDLDRVPTSTRTEPRWPTSTSVPVPVPPVPVPVPVPVPPI